MTSWREHLRRYPELATVSAWPLPDVQGLDEHKRAQFAKRLAILTAVVEHGHSVPTVARDFGISVSHIYYLLKRALEPSGSAGPALAGALVAFRNIKPYRRIADTEGADRRAMSGAFTYLLNNTPGLTEYLDKLLKSNLSNASRPTFPLSRFHQALLTFLIEEGVTTDEYPFNTKGRARETARVYYRKRTQALLAEGETKKFRSDFVRVRAAGIFVPMELFEIDEHLADIQLTLKLRHVSGWHTTLRVRRFWLILVIDVGSKAAVGYAFGYSRNTSTDDFLEALASVNTPWNPKQLTTPGLAYPPGAGMPAGLIPAYAHAVPLMVALDNAWAHHSQAVRQTITDRWGAAIDYGMPGHPTARGIVENVFARLEASIHALPGTTGSHPRDPLRKKGANLPAVSVEQFEELIDVAIAAYNATPRSDLGASPLEALEQTKEQGFFIRHLAKTDRDRSNFFEGTTYLWVRGNLRTGIRAHVNWQYARYKGVGLDQNAWLLGKRVRCTYDRRDIRTLYLWSGSNQPLGRIHVSGPWQGFAHSVALRRQAMSVTRQRRDNVLRPWNAYLDHLLHKRNDANAALDLLRLYRAADSEVTSTLSGADTASEPTIDSAPSVLNEPSCEPEKKPVGTLKNAAKRHIQVTSDPSWWK